VGRFLVVVAAVVAAAAAAAAAVAAAVAAADTDDVADAVGNTDVAGVAHSTLAAAAAGSFVVDCDNTHRGRKGRWQ